MNNDLKKSKAFIRSCISNSATVSLSSDNIYLYILNSSDFRLYSIMHRQRPTQFRCYESLPYIYWLCWYYCILACGKSLLHPAGPTVFNTLMHAHLSSRDHKER